MDDGDVGDVPDAVVVAERLAEVRRRIAAVDRAWNHDVAITAVTKGFDAAVIEVAVDAGCTRIGENYAQELIAKRPVLDGLANRRPAVEFIGRLQTNKVRQLVDIVDRWSSVDRSSLVRELVKRCPGAEVLVQVNATGEEGKGGCAVEEVDDLVAEARRGGLDVIGLMTVGPTDAPAAAARPGFEQVRALVDRLGLEVCSMGMSADLDIAVAAGSNEVRVGTALFGPRPPR